MLKNLTDIILTAAIKPLIYLFLSDFNMKQNNTEWQSQENLR